MVAYHPISPRYQAKIHQFGKKSRPLVRGSNLERGYSDRRSGRFGEKLGCVRYLSSKNQRERSIDQTKNDEFIFPFPDCTAKPTVRSEDFSGDLQGAIGRPGLQSQKKKKTTTNNPRTITKTGLHQAISGIGKVRVHRQMYRMPAGFEAGGSQRGIPCQDCQVHDR